MRPGDFGTELEKVLCLLFAAKSAGSDGFLDAATIWRQLREEHSEHVHWRRVASLLQENRSLVCRRKRNRRWQYSILAKGCAVLTSTDAEIRLIDPAKAMESLVAFQEFLSGLKGVIRVCDPYLDHATVEHLDACTSASEVRLLTFNISDSGMLRRALAAFTRPGRKLIIRKASHATLHDRYLLDRSSMKILGTSLNGFGKKECFIINVGDDIRATMLKVFDDKWKISSPWP